MISTLLISVVAAAASAPEEDLAYFESNIRPVFAKHCYECHGGGKVEGGLLLTSRAGLLAGGDGGPVVVPGEPDQSRLLEAIRYTNVELQMPPESRLSADAVREFEIWIRNGAVDPRSEPSVAAESESNAADAYDFEEGREHWAYKAVADPAPPVVQDDFWPSDAIDHFVLSELEARGLRPVSFAGKCVLIRRATYDLHGLPPTETEINEFLADDTPDAYAKLVDRLLASDRYGERWGRHWLDVARYADSNGRGQNVLFPNAYRYRDYVIRSFNEDKPYDVFVTEQLAGDLMPNPADDQLRFEHLTGTGFLMMGPKSLAERDREKMLMDIVDEQLDVASKAFMGQTISCARCHDHKFDPIPARDYYALAGIFASTTSMHSGESLWDWNEEYLAVDEEVEAFERVEAAWTEAKREFIKFRNAENEQLFKERMARFADYLLVADSVSRQGQGKALVEVTVKEKGLDVLVVERLAERLSESRTKGDPLFTIWNALSEIGSDQLADDADEIIARLKSEMDSGDDKVSLATWSVISGGAPRDKQELAERYAALFNFAVRARKAAMPEDDEESGDADVGERAGDVRAVEVGEANLELGHGELLSFLDNREGPFRLAYRDETELYSDEARAKLDHLRAAVKASRESMPPQPAKAMAVAEGDVRDIPIHLRGNHLTKSKTAVRRSFLEVLDPVVARPEVPDHESGRLELARWLTDPDHPLTARVMVNRIWMHHFGTGIVDTPNNFGTTGSAPTHPALLDHLAGEFIESGWSIKAMHRRMMLSSTYRLASSFDEGNANIDAENTYYWRMNRQRLEAESVRDAMLAVGGNLDLTMYGLVDEFDVDAEIEKVGDSIYAAPRRSVYLPVVRNAIYPLMANLDFGTATAPVGKRPDPIVAPQALLMMNSPFVLEQAGRFADRILEDESLTLGERLEAAFVLAYSRPPAAAEAADAQSFIELAMLEHESSSQSDLSPERWAWRNFCQVLMASNEFLYIN